MFVGADKLKYKILELLKQRHDFVSGEEMGQIFNISRAAVWKNVATLRKEGYNIDSVASRGYRLADDDNNALNSYEINIENCIYLPEVDSTNLEAKRTAAKPFKDKLLIVCGRQLNGRGRLGRQWEDKGENVCMSYLFKPDISPMEAQQLTLVSGMAVCDALRELTGLECMIKWPNDIIINGKKLSGILTEMSAEMDHINYVVVGVGINVNCTEYDGELKEKATSLALQLGHKVKRADVIRLCSKKVFDYYDRYCLSGFADFMDEYNHQCINIGKKVKAIYKTHTISGKALGIDKNGALVILGDDGIKTAVSSGEVSLRLDNDKYI